MKLAEIKKSGASKTKIFQIERAIVREMTDLWCRDRVFFSGNFAENVEVEFKGRKISVTLPNRGQMNFGSPEATVNEMMRGLILTMATDPETGKLLKNHKSIISNILDVFVYRLKEIAERKFIYQRLQSLELGFSIAFGLDPQYYALRRDRHFLEEILTLASLSTAEETVEALIHDMTATQTLTPRKAGVTFHIFMGREKEASFLSLPFGIEQAGYISLLGTHTLRCNILADLGVDRNIKSGILKIDAPPHPVNFIAHKGLDLAVEEDVLMEKLRTTGPLCKKDFSPDELDFLKLLFNEYVLLADFLMSSRRIDPGLRLLIIFPRINFFKILQEENAAVPQEEPAVLGDLAALRNALFAVERRRERRKGIRKRRISERLIQERVLETVRPLAMNIIRNVYKPVTDIRRAFVYYSQRGYTDQKKLATIRQRVEEISAYLKKVKRIQWIVFEDNGTDLNIEASVTADPPAEPASVVEEIVNDIQAAEVEHIKEIVVSKMLDYLSFITVRLEQLDRVSSLYIKEEAVKKIEAYSASVLVQARSFYKMMSGREVRKRR